jgi:2-polyprenyl-3-methyl-5-hydroxy-6-metoxy-1,4-benzoquinol methylase
MNENENILGKRNVTFKVVSSITTDNQDLIDEFMHNGEGPRPWECFELTQGQDVEKWCKDPDLIEGIKANLQQLSNHIHNISQNNPDERVRVLDVGCYAGYLYDYLVKHHNCIEYTGIDVNEDVVDAAKVLHNDTPARYIVGDILNPSDKLIENSFDIVCCHRVIIHLPYFEQVLFNLINLSRDTVHIILLVGEKDLCEECMETNLDMGKIVFYFRRVVSIKTIQSILDKRLYPVDYIVETCNDSKYSSLFIFK